MKNINQKREQFFTLNTFLKATSFLIGAGMIGIVSLGLFGCNDDKSGTKNENLVHAVATTGMIADIVTNVGGEYVDVVGLMGPGVDPHLYRASEGDVRKLSDANIIFYNGLHLEAKMGDIFKKLNKQKPTVAVAERIPKDKLKKPPEFEGQFDPHVWFDVELWAYAVDAVGDTLITLDPENKEAFLRNKAAYLTKLNKLNTWIEEKTDMIPKEQRVLVTAHDAFNYYGLAYGFVVKGLMGISTESEAGTRDIQNLATYIVDNKIPAIFIESSISKRNIEVEMTTNGTFLKRKVAENLLQAGLTFLRVSLYNHPRQVQIFEKRLKGLPFREVKLIERWDPDLFNTKTNRAGFFENTNEKDQIKTNRPCNYPFYHMLINHTGEVYLCPQDWSLKYSQGNIKTSTIMGIWMNDKYQNYRKILATNRNIKPCSDCNADGLVYHNQSRFNWISEFGKAFNIA